MKKHLQNEAETAWAMEEAENVLRQLTALTEKGRIVWSCLSYDPLDLMPAIQEGKPETAYLIHIVVAEGEFNGRIYLTEIEEILTIPGSEGSVAVVMKIMCSDRLVASYVWDDDSEDAQIGFASAVLPQIADSDAVAQGFQIARYNTIDTPDDIAAHPLTILGRQLCQERRLLDYHRIAIDAAYREKNLSEMSDAAK